MDTSTLVPGLYRVHWKNGNNVLAAVGGNAASGWWLAPVDARTPGIAPEAWSQIDRVTLLHYAAPPTFPTPKEAHVPLWQCLKCGGSPDCYLCRCDPGAAKAQAPQTPRCEVCAQLADGMHAQNIKETGKCVRCWVRNTVDVKMQALAQIHAKEVAVLTAQVDKLTLARRRRKP